MMRLAVINIVLLAIEVGACQRCARGKLRYVAAALRTQSVLALFDAVAMAQLVVRAAHAFVRCTRSTSNRSTSNIGGRSGTNTSTSNCNCR